MSYYSKYIYIKIRKHKIVQFEINIKTKGKNINNFMKNATGYKMMKLVTKNVILYYGKTID